MVSEGRKSVACVLALALSFAAAAVAMEKKPGPTQAPSSIGVGQGGAVQPYKLEWVDLEPVKPASLAFQDQLHAYPIPSAPGVVLTATHMKPAGYIWIKPYVKNNGNIAAGPFKVRLGIKRAEGGVSDTQLVQTPWVLEQTYSCNGLAPGAVFEFGTNYPIEVSFPTTKIYVSVNADPHAGGLSEGAVEYGMVKEKKGANWMEFNNAYQYWYVIKKP